MMRVPAAACVTLVESDQAGQRVAAEKYFQVRWEESVCPLQMAVRSAQMPRDVCQLYARSKSDAVCNAQHILRPCRLLQTS